MKRIFIRQIFHFYNPLDISKIENLIIILTAIGDRSLDCSSRPIVILGKAKKTAKIKNFFHPSIRPLDCGSRAIIILGNAKKTAKIKNFFHPSIRPLDCGSRAIIILGNAKKNRTNQNIS